MVGEEGGLLLLVVIVGVGRSSEGLASECNAGPANRQAGGSVAGACACAGVDVVVVAGCVC